MASGQSLPLVGRDDEQIVLTGLLDEDSARALLLRGAAGAGKSALLDMLVTEAGAAGFRTLRATGVPAESTIAYAGLHQLLHPLLALTAGMDPAHRGILDAVLGGAPHQPPSVMALGVAVLDLLALVAAKRPLLLVLDDGQWLDSPSAQVSAFVARRIGDLPLRLVVAVRDTERSGFDDAGLDELAVTPLSPAAAADLLDSRFPGLAPDLRRLTLEHASGNPLALVELPPSLTGRDGQDPRPLEQIFTDRIRALPGPERADLLRMALDGAGRRSFGTHYVPRRITTARETGLVEPVLLQFRHPLVASAVVEVASLNDRRAAHADLARLHAADPERRAMHLAAATVDPDPEVAAALEQGAGLTVRRGGAATAVQWLTRAAELNPRPRDRARLLADAAFVAGQAGLLERAETLVAAA
ncbi:ATP-binding protein [Actinoplanes sp. NBC_00393]|uniref:ATP-binding protein n=1 Tax=Actinoplanes sp. NBC_00393 TaxID=2975953 RepID=UPI002E201E9B